MAGPAAAPRVIYRRKGGTPPADNEVLTLPGDGTFDLWRTISRASRPPSPVGRFAGRLDSAPAQAVADAAAACAAASPVTHGPPAGAALDQLVVGESEISSTFAEDFDPGEPWGALTLLCRRLLGELTAWPVAALTVVREGTSATLRQLGPQGLELDLSRAAVQAVRWEDQVVVENWQALANGPRSVTAGPGWTYDLPFGHGFGADATVSALVDNVLAFDGNFWCACSVQGS